jgi:hypothetical protein
MQNMQNKLDSLSLAKKLLYCPFSKEGLANDSIEFSPKEVTPEERKKAFYENVYANPFFFTNDWITTSDRNEECDEEEREYIRYNKNYVSGLKSGYNEIWDSFTGECKTNYPLSSPLYILEGSIGSGKSTFINKLKRALPEFIGNRYSYDFEKPPSSIKFMGFRCSNKEKSPIGYLKLILLECISNTLEEVVELEDGIHNLYQIYNNHFERHDDDDYVSFFEHINSYVIGSGETFNKCIYDYFEKSVLNLDKTEMLETLTGIFLRLLALLPQIESDYKGKNFLFCLDNVEHLITLEDDTKLNVSISDAKVLLISITRATNKLDNIIKASGNRRTVSVLLAMRDSTHGILEEIRRTSPFPENCSFKRVRMSDWYDTQDILEKRIQYIFNKKLTDVLIDEDIIKSPGVFVFNIATSDKSKFEWGLESFLSYFYNDSKRIVIERLLKRFLYLYEQEPMNIIYNNKYINKLDYFNENWKLIKGSNDSAHLIQLCRKYLIRLTLDYVNNYNYKRGPVKIVRDEDKLFYKIMSIFRLPANPKEIEINSYARRVLLYLATQTSEDSEYRFVAVEELIDKIAFHDSRFPSRSEKQVSVKKIEALSDILFNLNEIKDEDTNWVGLIFMNVPNGTMFKKEKFREHVKDAWGNYVKSNDQNLETVTVKITKAGEWFSRFMLEFEYFACAYIEPTLEEFVPLLAIDNNSILQKLLDKVYAAVEMFFDATETVERKIFKNDIVWDMPQNNYIVSTVNKHIGYLDKFRQFLERDDLCSLPANVRRDMVETLKTQINKYNQLKNKF